MGKRIMKGYWGRVDESTGSNHSAMATIVNGFEGLMSAPVFGASRGHVHFRHLHVRGLHGQLRVAASLSLIQLQQLQLVHFVQPSSHLRIKGEANRTLDELTKEHAKRLV